MKRDKFEGGRCWRQFLSKWRVVVQLPANNHSTSSQCKDSFTIGITLKLMAVAEESLTKVFLGRSCTPAYSATGETRMDWSSPLTKSGSWGWWHYKQRQKRRGQRWKNMRKTPKKWGQRQTKWGQRQKIRGQKRRTKIETNRGWDGDASFECSKDTKQYLQVPLRLVLLWLRSLPIHLSSRPGELRRQ